MPRIMAMIKLAFAPMVKAEFILIALELQYHCLPVWTALIILAMINRQLALLFSVVCEAQYLGSQASPT